MSAHTPTPWEAFDENNVVGIHCPGTGADIAHCRPDGGYFDSSRTREEDIANAAFIVRAVNNIERIEKVNEALVKALENARMGLVFAAREGVKISEDSPLLSEITAALKLARGEA